MVSAISLQIHMCNPGKLHAFQIGAFTLLMLFSIPAEAQKNQIGIQVSGMHLHKIDEAPIGVGARYNYNFLPLLATDFEVSHYPENSSGNFGETTALFGIRAGVRIDRVGVFLKARPGVIHFGGEYFVQRLDQRTHPIFDLGGVVEYYPAAHIFLRIDAGDAVIYYGNARLFNRPNPDALGTVHNFQPGFGVGVRF
jgi:hypothetical protein